MNLDGIKQEYYQCCKAVMSNFELMMGHCQPDSNLGKFSDGLVDGYDAGQRMDELEAMYQEMTGHEMQWSADGMQIIND